MIEHMHKQYLLAALEQALEGRGLCAPNPSVGAIAVHNGAIIARSSHRGAGTPHAEQLLLDKLPKNITDLTLYVTLEPCNHWGKTPPCVDEIIKYGVKRVVFAYRDPNPIIVANDSQHRLRSHGIEVIHCPLPEIDAFYASYRQWTLTQRPWVTVKMAQSLDGKIAGPGGQPLALSNATCAEFTHQQRSLCDIILTTAKTVNQDNPQFNARLTAVHVAKPVAILDTNLQLNPTATLFNTAKHLHVYYNAEHVAPVNRSNCYYHAMPVVDSKLDLKAVISHLGQLGYHDV
jgi:diaminohydroxyphosphoribosylaminopyrimidine deaminase/5-amino-6-(5-phosphoribosylamino)uracil reductase